MHANDTLVENNYFGNGHGASISSLCDDWLRNITVRNTVFNGTTSGIRIKTHPKCAGEVKEVVYENLSMTNVETVLAIDMFYEDDGDQEDVDEDPLTCRSERHLGWRKVRGAEGDKDSPCEDIDLQDFRPRSQNGTVTAAAATAATVVAKRPKARPTMSPPTGRASRASSYCNVFLVQLRAKAEADFIPHLSVKGARRSESPDTQRRIVGIAIFGLCESTNFTIPLRGVYIRSDGVYHT